MDLSLFLSLFEQQLFWIDVRSPKEFADGHIPGAINLPLFSDEERAIVGTVYKKEGKRAAIERGLSLLSLPLFIARINDLALPSKLILYCARGGMRSQAMGWLFNLLGYEVKLLPGGYKAFRNWILSCFSASYTFLILSGKTGVGKTAFLQQLQENNEPVLDLETLANHRGSVFGAYDTEQPSQEHFENLLALSLFRLRKSYFWIEDESRFIGKIRIPDGLFLQMQQAKTVLLATSLETRIQRLVKEYSSQKVEKLSSQIQKLNKKLGEEAMRKALLLLQENNFPECCKILLHYYDKRYETALFARTSPPLFVEENPDISSLISLKKSLLNLSN